MTDLAQWLGKRSFDDWHAEFEEQGFLVFEKVLDDEKLAAVNAALKPHLDENVAGRNDFEGLKSNRIYGMLAKDPVFAELCVHPLALAFAERDLGPSCLLSACLAINLQPGESVQPWHTDDGHIDIAPPHDTFKISTFWALTDTTEQNGATEVLPGSHRWSLDDFAGALKGEDFANREVRDASDDPGYREDALKVTMPAGSLMIAKGNLWHRGGANHSEENRLIITPQYCKGWARPLENMMAVVPRETAAAMPERLQELIGYSIHPPFMGYVDGVHPRKLLG